MCISLCIVIMNIVMCSIIDIISTVSIIIIIIIINMCYHYY